MNEIVEGSGTAAEGGLLARALDPPSGERRWHPHQPEACLNCGTALRGAYCHACGQQGHVHRTIGGFVHDLLHGALHFEGKLWRTLPMLVLRPGKLTRRYVQGERARFVSPMALFLFTVFLMFAVFQITGAARSGLEAETVQSGPKEAGSIPGIETELPTQTGFKWLDEVLIKKWQEHPDLMLYKLQSNAYKFSWLLIPISIPFVWLLFAWRRRFKAYDHAIFVTYSLSFMTLLFIVLSMVDATGAGGDWLVLAGLLVPPLHIYKQLRGAYDLSRLSAAWRLAALMIFMTIIVALFVQILLLLGAF